MHFIRCVLCFIAAPDRVTWLNNERQVSLLVSSKSHCLLFTYRWRQTRRSTRSLPPFQDRIHDYIVALRIPDEWFQTPVMYERNLELRYFDSLCSKLEGALRSQKRLSTSRGEKVSCLKSSRDLFSPSSLLLLSLTWFTGCQKISYKNSVLRD